jgi:hypothetical protein
LLCASDEPFAARIFGTNCSMVPETILQYVSRDYVASQRTLDEHFAIHLELP